MIEDYYRKIRKQLLSLKMHCFGSVLGDHSWLPRVLLTMAHRKQKLKRLGLEN